MAGQDTLIRLIKIIHMFSKGRRLTVNEIHKGFKDTVGKRSIQRDLIRLSEASIPLQSERINNENVWWIESHFYDFINLPVDISEYIAADFMKNAFPVLKNTPLEKNFEELLDKIDQLVSENVRNLIKTDRNFYNDVFQVLEFGNYDYSEYREVIQQLTDAILNKKVCIIEYNKPFEGKKSFTVEPYKILIYKGALYLVVFHQGIKKFFHLAVHRIDELTVSKTVFERDKDYNAQEYIKDRFGLFSGKTESVKLHIKKDMVPYIEGRNFHYSQKIINNADGSMIMSMQVSVSDQLISWILSKHDRMKVLEPESLRKQIIKTLDNMKKLYTDDMN